MPGKRRAQDALDEAIVAYHESLTEDERAEDEALARSLSKASVKVAIDDDPGTCPPRGEKTR